MKELDNKDLENISGGVGPLAQFGYAMVAAYGYEAVGGKAGIDRYFSNGWASTKSSVRYWYRKAF